MSSFSWVVVLATLYVKGPTQDRHDRVDTMTRNRPLRNDGVWLWRPAREETLHWKTTTAAPQFRVATAMASAPYDLGVFAERRA